MQYEVVCNLTLMRYFAGHINKYTAMAMTDLRYLILVGWMYGTDVVLPLDEQSVRLLVLVRVCLNLKALIIGVQYSMRP